MRVYLIEYGCYWFDVYVERYNEIYRVWGSYPIESLNTLRYYFNNGCDNRYLRELLIFGDVRTKKLVKDLIKRRFEVIYRINYVTHHVTRNKHHRIKGFHLIGEGHYFD